jgi:protein-serine/threonine kinase
MPPSKSSNGPGGQVGHRIKSFFRINSSSGSSDKDKTAAAAASSSSAAATLSPTTANNSDSMSGGPKPSRHTKFFSNTVGRLRAHTVASEGNQLEEALSPTAFANPYFSHQGPPGLRHHNTDSVPPSPPDTPTFHVSGPDGAPTEQATSETKEELARRLRRVASAPNAQGLFAKDASKAADDDPDRPATAELGKDPLVQNPKSGSLGLAETDSPKPKMIKTKSLGVPSDDGLGALAPPSAAFRRTYSSNSIKVRNVEVGPSSFDKIKLIGKGDVGKVYLVREKKSGRLYAMKGALIPISHIRLNDY